MNDIQSIVWALLEALYDEKIENLLAIE